MSTHTPILGYILTFAYGVAFALFIYLQESIGKTQILIPEKYLVLTAVVFALFGGAASYALQLQQKPGDKFHWRELWQTMILSGFVALLIGLFAAGLVSDTWWLAGVALSAFFKNVIIALIPRAIELKLAQHLSLTPDNKHEDTPKPKVKKKIIRRVKPDATPDTDV